MTKINLTERQMLRYDELRHQIDQLSAENNDLAASVFELGGNVADQTEPFDWADYE
jgi:hypothetical protein